MEGSVEVGGSGYADAYADFNRGFGVEAAGSAYGGAHAGAALDVNAIGLGAHAGAEFNTGWGVYGSAKGGWTNEKGLTLGLSGGFGLQFGFGVDAEVSFHPGKTWDAAVSTVEGAVVNASNVVGNVAHAATEAVDWTGKQLQSAGAAVGGVVSAMDPRNWKWPW